MFTATAMSRQWERLASSGAGEWCGTWTRYAPSGPDTPGLKPAPPIRAVCSIAHDGACLRQTNTYYEGGEDDAPRVVEHPRRDATTFAAMPETTNSIVLLPADGSVSWCTLAVGGGAGASIGADTAAVELIVRRGTRRARVVVVYKESGAEGSWRLRGVTSIREACESSADVPSAPRTASVGGSDHFTAAEASLSAGWMCKTDVIQLRGADGAPLADPPETSTRTELDSTLSERLAKAHARPDVPEADVLLIAPDDILGPKTSETAETAAEIGLVWCAAPGECLALTVSFDGRGRLCACRHDCYTRTTAAPPPAV